MDADEDRLNVVTLEDLHKRSSLPGLGELEVEEITDEDESRGERPRKDWNWVRQILIGIISSLLAAGILYVFAKVVGS